MVSTFSNKCKLNCRPNIVYKDQNPSNPRNKQAQVVIRGLEYGSNDIVGEYMFQKRGLEVNISLKEFPIRCMNITPWDFAEQQNKANMANTKSESLR